MESPLFLSEPAEFAAAGHFFARLGVALVCGAVVGMEREYRGKAAGLRTNVLICMGACLFTMVSLLSAKLFGGPNVDPGRIAAQIVSGIGFLGAGAILRSGFSVQGLTTAATIWFVAGIGMVIGIGFPLLGLGASVAALFVLVGLQGIDRLIPGKPPPEDGNGDGDGPGKG